MKIACLVLLAITAAHGQNWSWGSDEPDPAPAVPAAPAAPADETPRTPRVTGPLQGTSEGSSKALDAEDEELHPRFFNLCAIGIGINVSGLCYTLERQFAFMLFMLYFLFLTYFIFYIFDSVHPNRRKFHMEASTRGLSNPRSRPHTAATSPTITAHHPQSLTTPLHPRPPPTITPQPPRPITPRPPWYSTFTPTPTSTTTRAVAWT